MSSGPLVTGLPLILTLVLALMSFLPRVQQNVLLVRSFWGAAAMLLATVTGIAAAAVPARRAARMDPVVAIRHV